MVNRGLAHFSAILLILAGSVFILAGCNQDAPEVDLAFTDDFSSDTGTWKKNSSFNLYSYTTVNINTTTSGALTMWGTNPSSYTGSYSGMMAMVFANKKIADTLWTMSVDASFVDRPVSTVASNQVSIVIYFNVTNTESFDCLAIRSDGTWDLRVYSGLVELDTTTNEQYTPVKNATLPTGAFNADGINHVVITQATDTISISVNGVALPTPAHWPYSGYDRDVHFGLGFKYESGVPASSMAGPKVVFDNCVFSEYEVTE